MSIEMEMSTDQEEQEQLPKQCFTSIQSRKLLGSLESCELCPSMDLVLYRTSASQIQPHHLYRTVSWQKVASITPSTEAASVVEEGTTAPGADVDIDSEAAAAAAGIVADGCCCWSPSGRWIAVATEPAVVSLYGVEPLANPPNGGAAFGGAVAATEARHSWSTQHPVTALAWAHVGRAHPTAWHTDEDETEHELSWRYQSQYVDQAKLFLPPSGYLQPADGDEDQHLHQEQTTTTALPECKTPLSVLCVSTTQTLELYLHGRYPLLTLDRPSASTPPNIVVSNDMSYILVQSMEKVSMYYLPFLNEDRYPLQIMASLQASITSHLTTLQQSIVEVSNAWRSSLKPLDTKLTPLLKLLKNYGVDDQPVGAILKQYILVGHTSESSSVANAIDQFFTSIQMNDQLLQRMERSLHSALANVESQARKGLLSPIQALCYDIQELAGHVQFHAATDRDTTSAALQELSTASGQLWMSVETVIRSMVQGRCLVRDLCGWLRSAGSQVKARGTAPNSVQRENAKKRRVPQAVLERLLTTLNTAPFANEGSSTSSLSEHLLNLPVSNLFEDTATPVLLSASASKKPMSVRPNSPSSVVADFGSSTLTVTHVTQCTLEAAQAVFTNPLSNIPKSILPTDFLLPTVVPDSGIVVAIHPRVGRDVGMDDGASVADEKQVEPTYFAPRLLSDGDGDDFVECRQWSIVAQAQGTTVQLFAIPLGWRDVDVEEDQEDEGRVSFYLTTKLTLDHQDEGGTIRDVGFYGDDGKSSLSSGNDSGTGKEGRQKLGLLVQSRDQLELWLTSYHALVWQEVPLESSSPTMTLQGASQVPDSFTATLQAIQGDAEEEDIMTGDRVTFAQTRVISTLESEDDQVQLLLCGSRGVGAVAIGSQGVTAIELLDLEEDEEVDDEEVDDDEYDDEDE